MQKAEERAHILEGFRIALDVSAYSLIGLTRAVVPLMKKRGGGTVLTLTYLGSQRVFTNYNVMGVAKAALEASVRYLASELGPDNIRVNAISAGPIKTLASAGIAGFSKILKHVETFAPLRRNVTIEDVGNAAAFLLSDLAAGITAEILYVDGGFNVVSVTIAGENGCRAKPFASRTTSRPTAFRRSPRRPCR